MIHAKGGKSKEGTEQINLFTYLGPDFDYASIRLDSDILCNLPEPYKHEFRDTGVPMGFRHWKHDEPIDTIVYYFYRFLNSLNDIWEALWSRN